MLRPKVVTPYYLHGRSAQRFHADHASRAAAGAAAAGAVGGALYHPKTQAAAIHFVHQYKGYAIHPQHAQAFGTALGFAAGGAAVYAGVHAYKANKYKKRLKGRGSSTTHRH